MTYDNIIKQSQACYIQFVFKRQCKIIKKYTLMIKQIFMAATRWTGGGHCLFSKGGRQKYFSLVNDVMFLITFIHHHSTWGSAIAERPMQRFVSVEMLSYCCTNNAYRSLYQPKKQFHQLPRFILLPAHFVHTSLQ